MLTGNTNTQCFKQIKAEKLFLLFNRNNYPPNKNASDVFFCCLSWGIKAEVVGVV